MKKLMLLVCGVILLCSCATVKRDASRDAIEFKRMQTFMKEAGCYFIATVDGKQARVRPFGTFQVFEGKVYIQTGRKKNVGKQILKNGRVELCAINKDKTEWLRISGELVEDERKEAKAAVLDAYPELKSMYSADDKNTLVFYFEPGTATATYWSMKKAPEKFEF